MAAGGRATIIPSELAGAVGAQAGRADSLAGEIDQVDLLGESSLAPSRPLRFTLRTLLGATAVVAVALAVWQAVGPLVGLTLLLVSIALSLHVVGNALGTRLRDHGAMRTAPVPVEDSLPPGACPRRSAGAPLPAHQFAPATRLSRRAALGWPPLAVAFSAGLLGAIGGGRVTQQLYPDVATWSALAVGALAAGALAAMFAYWTSSWLHVFLAAWWQAHCDAHRG